MEDNSICGYASVFNEPDQHGDVMLPGAFLGNKKDDIPVLWQHHPNVPIGRVVEMQENAVGLRIRMEICLDTQMGRDAMSLIKSGVLKGLSVGYTVKKSARGQAGVRRKLLKVDLKEVSLVTFPAHPKAKVFDI